MQKKMLFNDDYTTSHPLPVVSAWSSITVSGQLTPPGYVDENDVVTMLESNPTCELLIQSVLLPTLCCLGILGNMLNIFVLTRQRIRRGVKTRDQAINVGLISLAVSDMIVCISTLPRAFVAEYELFFDRRSFAFYYQIYSTGMITTFGLISTWLIVITAAIRYVATCFPLHTDVALGHTGSCVAILVTYFACALANLPSFYLFQAREYRTTNGTEVRLLIDLGDFNHTTRQGFVFHWMRAVTVIFVPGVLLSFFNIRLIQTLHRSDIIRRRHIRTDGGGVCSAVRCHHHPSRNRLNVTLVAVIVMFFCLVYPCELLDFFAHLTPLGRSSLVDREVLLVARMVLNTLQLFHFALNFILYCTFNAQFRRTVTDLCCRRPRLRITRILGHEVLRKTTVKKSKKPSLQEIKLVKIRTNVVPMERHRLDDLRRQNRVSY